MIYSNIILQDGSSITQAFSFPNKSYSHNINGRLSKYIQPIKSTITVNIKYSNNIGQVFLNKDLLNTMNYFINLKPGLNFHITKWMNVSYNCNMEFIQTTIDHKKMNSIIWTRHYMDLFAFPTKLQSISFTGEYYKHAETNGIFVDILYRYTFKKPRIDIELSWKNIFNNKVYTTYSTNSFAVYQSTFILRPSQMSVSVRFGF